MVEIYNVGQDVPYDLPDQDERFEWLVYWYEDGGYDGNGECVGYNKEDGMLYTKNLGHCSCYGPFDGWGTDCTKVTPEEFFRDKDSIFDPDNMDVIKKKVAELIPWAVPSGKVFKEKFDLLGEVK